MAFRMVGITVRTYHLYTKEIRWPRLKTSEAMNVQSKRGLHLPYSPILRPVGVTERS